MTRGPSLGSVCADFIESLEVPQGKRAGQNIKLAPFQRKFLRGALKQNTRLGVLCIGRGNGKTMLSAGVAVASLVGAIDTQRSRDIIFAARNREQARIGWQFAGDLCRSLPDALQAKIKYRRGPNLEIEFDGKHLIRAIPADGRSVLGTAPTLAILDERGHWEREKGDELEHAIASGLGKRDGRQLVISTSASDDTHPFSKLIDSPPDGAFVMEFRPEPGLPADDLTSIKLANPGAQHGIGSSLEWLQGQARQAIQRGGSALSTYRLYNRNERVSTETRAVLVSLDEWLRCETPTLPPRQGPCVIGCDLGASASMTASAFYWPQTGRLETRGWFPNNPGLAERGASDGVGDRYVLMSEAGELSTLGDRTVTVGDWIAETVRHVEGCEIYGLVADRFKQAEFEEAAHKAGIRTPIIFRGMGYRDGGEDCDRFRRAVFDEKVASPESLLLRSALTDTVCLADPAGNVKLAKARSLGRIDAAAAAVLAVAEGVRLINRPQSNGGRLIWA
ncbi:MAG: terminase large subunit [Pseudomonadota bacterium]